MASLLWQSLHQIVLEALRRGVPVPPLRLAVMAAVVFVPAPSTGWKDSLFVLSSTDVSPAPLRRAVHDEWHLKQSWYSATGWLVLDAGTDVKAGGVPAAPFRTGG